MVFAVVNSSPHLACCTRSMTRCVSLRKNPHMTVLRHFKYSWPSPSHRYALYVFRTCHGAFGDTQELACTGGLDVQASDDGLQWIVERAGVTDIERLVVTTMLWQIVDHIEENALAVLNANRMDIPDFTGKMVQAGTVSAQGVFAADGSAVMHDEEDFAREDITDALSTGVVEHSATEIDDRRHLEIEDNQERQAADPVSKQATLVCEKWLEQALQRAMGRIEAEKGSVGQTSRASASLRSYLVSDGGVSRSKAICSGLVDMDATDSSTEARESLEVVTHPRDTNKALSSSFDRALSQTLLRLYQQSITLWQVESTKRAMPAAGTGWTAAAAAAAKLPTTGGATQGKAGWNVTNVHEGRPLSEEDMLLYTYIIAGFAPGSDLTLDDIIMAIKYRRRKARVDSERVLDGNRYEGRALAKRKSSHSNDDRGDIQTNRFRNAGKERDATSGNMKTGFEGVPPELEELFRAAAFAQFIRARRTVSKKAQVLANMSRAPR